MSTTTATLGLIKPELTDVADITATNSNWDTIDSKFQEFSNVDNTPDNEKNVAYADKAGTADKTIVNIGVVTEGNGSAYKAQVDGITELTAGLSFIIIPHVVSTTTTPTLNVNGLGAKNIRQPLSTNTSATTTAESASWLVANKPVRVMYDGTQWKVDITRPSATNLYGTLPIENGGTGGTTVEDAQSNLGIITLQELPNLYIWKKFSGNPALVETDVTNVDLAYWSIDNAAASFQSIQYADDIVINDGVISLVNPSQKTFTSSIDCDLLIGKCVYSYYQKSFYKIPSTATVRYSDGTYGNYKQVRADSAIKLTTGGTKIEFVASKKSTTYPTSGEHTDGYWYEYHKQLGE